MSEERCEAFAKTMATPASWHVLNDRERDFVRDALAKHHALLAEERRKRDAAERELPEADEELVEAEEKLAEARSLLQAIYRDAISIDPAGAHSPMGLRVGAFLARLSKKEPEAGTRDPTPEELLRYEEAWGDD